MHHRPRPQHRPPVAGYFPVVALRDVLALVGLLVALVAALWWTGHPTGALALAIVLGATAPAAACWTLEETWVGEDWLSNRFIGTTVVVDADRIDAIEMPATDTGLNYLVFRSDDRRVRVSITELLARPALAAAILTMLDTRSGPLSIDPLADRVLHAARLEVDRNTP